MQCNANSKNCICPDTYAFFQCIFFTLTSSHQRIMLECNIFGKHRNDTGDSCTSLAKVLIYSIKLIQVQEKLIIK